MAVDQLDLLDVLAERVETLVEARVITERPLAGQVRPPYVLLSLPPPDRAAERFGGTSSLRDGQVTTEVGGTSQRHALYLQDQLADALLDWTPELAGAVLSRLTYYTRPRYIEPESALPGVLTHSVSTIWEYRAEPNDGDMP